MGSRLSVNVFSISTVSKHILQTYSGVDIAPDKAAKDFLLWFEELINLAQRFIGTTLTTQGKSDRLFFDGGGFLSTRTSRTISLGLNLPSYVL